MLPPSEQPNAPLRVAIVHDWLVGGGAERVVHELHRLYPEAPIYTSYCSDEWRAKLDGKVITGYLQRWPFSKLRKFLPILRIWWFENLDFSEFDLVISSSGNGEAKGIITMPHTEHVCYCHSPTHFYWRHYDQYLNQPGFGVFDPLVRLSLKLLVGPLRKWDLKAAQRPDAYIANSSHIQADIKQYYGRDSVVIHPPVDIARFHAPALSEPTATNNMADNAQATDTSRHGFITVGRQQPYKHTDIIVQACSQLNLPLTVIGRGPDHARLVAIAGPSVAFITAAEATDDAITTAMRSAQAFIFASHEDFGITPIEAMAAGTPLIAYQAGGALDYVQPGVTGEFFAEQTVESLTAALKTFDPTAYDHGAIRAAAEQFSTERFAARIKDYVDSLQVS